MAALWAKEVINKNKEYKEVPRLLKAKVKEILIDKGFEKLITE